jgi:hypothetical protein
LAPTASLDEGAQDLRDRFYAASPTHGARDRINDRHASQGARMDCIAPRVVKPPISDGRGDGAVREFGAQALANVDDLYQRLSSVILLLLRSIRITTMAVIADGAALN